MNCPKCGAATEDGVLFCRNCGARISDPVRIAERPAPEKSPSAYKLLGPWAYLGYSILFAIPVIGFIFLVVFSFSGANINRRNYARSYWCALLVFLILLIGLGILVAVSGQTEEFLQLMQNLRNVSGI